ncbi:hypothetical protein AM501_23905 [Aneurinibacillus migulanus]|uniref:TadE/TadG family type IV pilus assembly protein n=1 Tax=Aneurinibacillus migulanus TaxID=47500 RepID=UPI0005B87E6A|nr:TadE/TadG family type IV pilus assembly protein [Aneurinibacillus migulanus]KIV58946.1 hypothetical protein TS64_04075 [Aneurinibacillus migulanus]KPD05822.1 hypothetical protein AM501_23905 [Aneurinibacillus migulanus]
METIYCTIFILLLTAFAFTFALALYNWMVVEDGARDAARQIALGSATSDAHRIVDELTGPLVLGKREFNVKVEDLGDKVKVVASYKSLSFMPGLGAAFGGSPFDPYISIPATATFKKEIQ